MTLTTSIKDEGRALADRLAQLIPLAPEEIERAIRLQNETYLAEKRNVIAVLSTIAQLIALAEDLRRSGGSDWWTTAGPDGRTPLSRLGAGGVGSVCGDLMNRKAGPYDVEWDQHWPVDVARRRVRQSLPAGVRPGDILTAGEGGARVKLRVVQASDGTLTAELLANTWVNPPFEDVAAHTYRQLARAYPDAIPPLA